MDCHSNGVYLAGSAVSQVGLAGRQQASKLLQGKRAGTSMCINGLKLDPVGRLFLFVLAFFFPCELASLCDKPGRLFGAGI